MPKTIIKRRIRVRATELPDGRLVNARIIKKYPMSAKAVRQIAKSVVSKAAEDKFVSVSTMTSHNSTISSAAECYPMVPQITQGNGDFQRIGDKVRGKYLYIKGMVQYNTAYLDLLSTGQTTFVPPATLRVLILSQKNIKVGSEVSTAADVAHLLKDNVGTGTARAYTSGVFDNVAPINKDLFRVHMDKKIKLNFRDTNYFAGGGNAVQAGMVGNDRTKYFSCRIKCPATLTFDDGNGNWPNTFAPFLCMGGVNDDGSAPYTVGTPYRLTALSTLYFEDS